MSNFSLRCLANTPLPLLILDITFLGADFERRDSADGGNALRFHHCSHEAYRTVHSTDTEGHYQKPTG